MATTSGDKYPLVSSREREIFDWNELIIAENIKLCTENARLRATNEKLKSQLGLTQEVDYNLPYEDEEFLKTQEKLVLQMAQRSMDYILKCDDLLKRDTAMRKDACLKKLQSEIMASIESEMRKKYLNTIRSQQLEIKRLQGTTQRLFHQNREYLQKYASLKQSAKSRP